MRVPLDALQSLAWPARRSASGTRSGTHPSTLRGRAPELSAYRAYRSGDDVRDMDWKLLARSDRAYVRLSEDRAIHPTWIVVDATASMAFPVATRAKWEAACALATGLAFLAHKAGDPVGLRVVGGSAPGETTLAPSTRRDVVPALAALLAGVTPGGRASLGPAMAERAGGGRLVVVSDALEDGDAWRDAANHWLAAGGDVVVVQVLSREEWTPADQASVVDPEDPGCERELGAEARAGYAAALSAWVRHESDWWRARGAAFHSLVAEDDVVQGIRAIVAEPLAAAEAR